MDKATSPKFWAGPTASAARRALPFAAIAIAASWLGFYLIAPAPFLADDTFRATLVLHIVSGVIFLPYLVSLVAGRRLPGGGALDAPLFALLVALMLTTATSVDWRVSLGVALAGLLALGVFYVLADGRLLRRWQAERALMLAVVAAALGALWVVGGDYLDWLQLSRAAQGGVSLLPPTVPQVHGVGDDPAALGVVLAMGLPFLLASALRSGRASLRALAVLGAAAVLVAIFLTLSRASWLAAGIGVLVTATLLAICTDDGRALLRRLWLAQRRWMIGVLALATLAVAAAGVTYAVSSVEARPLWLFPDAGAARSDALQAGAEMLGDHQLLGTGPGVYRLLYPQYSGGYPIEAAATDNGFLQTAVDMGVLGLLAMAGLVVALVWLLVRGLLEAEGDARRSLVACAGSFSAFAMFSLFDAPNGAQGPLMMLAAVGAVAVLSHREGVAPSHNQTSRFRFGDVALAAVRVAVPVMLAGLLITWGRLDIGHYYYSNGLAAADAGRWSQAVGRAQRAVELDPQFALYRLQLGVVQGQAYLETGDRARLDEALAQLGRGVEMEPRSALGHANLALLLADALAREQARTEALAALRFANGDPAIALAAGTALEVSNWGEEAVDAYARAISMDPKLADSPFWSGSPFRRTEFAEIVRRSSLDTCAVLALAEVAPEAFGSGEKALNACRLLVEADPDDAAARVALAAALIDEGELDEAFVHLDEALARRPDYGPARTILGRWYEAQGEVEEARRQWLRAGQLRQPEALAFLGDSFAPDTVPPEIVRALRSQLADGEPYHSLGSLYYRHSFYRASPNVLLLPGEWQRAAPRALLRARSALARWTDAGAVP